MILATDRLAVMARDSRPVLGLRTGKTNVRQSRGFPHGMLWSFGYAQPTATTVTIYQGYLHIHGRGSYGSSATTTVTLSGATAYVYAEFTRSTGAFAVASASSASMPSTNSASHYRFPLYLFESSDGGSTYGLTKVHHGGNDISIGTAI